jgi:chromosomal replication initiator protein
VQSAFVAGPENCLVATAVLAVLSSGQASAEDQEQLNNPALGVRPLVLVGPLVFVGSSGVGKTHLTHGIAAEFRRNTSPEQVVLLPATDFARQYSEAIELQATSELTSLWRSARLLVIEDLQELAVQTSAQQAAEWLQNAQWELCRTLDALEAAGGQAIVTANARLETLALVPQLASRLAAGLIVEIASPGKAARELLATEMAARQGLSLSPVLLNRLAAGVTGPARNLYAALAQIALAQKLDDRSESRGGFDRECIDRECVDRVLAEFAQQREPSLERIVGVAARHFGLRPAVVRGPSRQRHVALARGVAMYLAREFTSLSFERIGDYFGGRDHTTVLHACRKLTARLDDPKTRAALDAVRGLCQMAGDRPSVIPSTHPD